MSQRPVYISAFPREVPTYANLSADRPRYEHDEFLVDVVAKLGRDISAMQPVSSKDCE